MPQPDQPHANLPATGLVLCPRCDWVLRVRAPAAHEYACCPRCRHRIVEGGNGHELTNPMAWALAALIMLALVFAFDFLGFERSGIGHVMSFVDAAASFSSHGFALLTVLFVLTTTVFPGMFLLGALYVSAAARSPQPWPWAIPVARLVRHIQMWMMSDVLLVGILVSLIKIVSLAQIRLGPSFLVFCGFSLLLLKTMNALDWPLLWRRLAGPAPQPARVHGGASGQAQGVISCGVCAAMLDL